MYAQDVFRETRQDVLCEMIEQIRLGLLVVPAADDLAASHVPMVVVRRPDGGLELECHVARANPLWKAAESPVRALAAFQGPNTYITPGWYPTKTINGKVVPTWNYVAVHAHGLLEAVQDTGWLHGHVSRLTDANEADRPEPWAVSDAPERYTQMMLRGIVGLRMTVDRLKGSWKMSQNREDQDRIGALGGLSTSECSRDRAVAAVMQGQEQEP